MLHHSASLQLDMPFYPCLSNVTDTNQSCHLQKRVPCQSVFVIVTNVINSQKCKCDGAQGNYVQPETGVTDDLTMASTHHQELNSLYTHQLWC